MPLSDHEQRLLEQMERALSAEDPKFVTAMRGADLRRRYQRRALLASLMFVVGIVMLIPAFFMILAVGWVLDHLFVEVADENEKNYARPQKASSAGNAFPGGDGAAGGPEGAAGQSDASNGL